MEEDYTSRRGFLKALGALGLAAATGCSVKYRPLIPTERYFSGTTFSTNNPDAPEPVFTNYFAFMDNPEIFNKVVNWYLEDLDFMGEKSCVISHPELTNGADFRDDSDYTLEHSLAEALKFPTHEKSIPIIEAYLHSQDSLEYRSHYSEAQRLLADLKQGKDISRGYFADMMYSLRETHGKTRTPLEDLPSFVKRGHAHPPGDTAHFSRTDQQNAQQYIFGYKPNFGAFYSLYRFGKDSSITQEQIKHFSLPEDLDFKMRLAVARYSFRQWIVGSDSKLNPPASLITLLALLPKELPSDKQQVLQDTTLDLYEKLVNRIENHSYSLDSTPKRSVIEQTIRMLDKFSTKHGLSLDSVDAYNINKTIIDEFTGHEDINVNRLPEPEGEPTFTPAPEPAPIEEWPAPDKPAPRTSPSPAPRGSPVPDRRSFEDRVLLDPEVEIPPRPSSAPEVGSTLARWLGISGIFVTAIMGKLYFDSKNNSS